MERTRVAITKINSPKINAPIVAEIVIPKSSTSNPRNELPIMVRATIRCEPDVNPKIDGPANGLFNVVCKSKPQIDKAKPAIIAIKTSGTR
ncbi:hypothetical protein D3C81_1994360 [compost metagenome]